MPTLTELREERKEAAQKAQDIQFLINAERREMSQPEEIEFERLLKTGEALTIRIEKEERLAAMIDRMETPHSRAERPNPDGGETRLEVRGGNGKKFRSFGEQMLAIRDHAVTGGIKSDPRLMEVRALGANEAISSDGGFLVQPEYATEIFRRVYETGQVASRCRRVTIGAQFNSAKLPAINETSRADASRWGGVLGYWAGEGGSLTATRPKFRMMDLVLKKLTGLAYATDELLQDSQLLESVLMQAFSEEIAFQLDAAIITGLGAGQPLGILNSAALVSVTAASGSGVRFLSADALNIYMRMWAASRANAVWFINQDVEVQLYSMTLGTATVNQAVYIPPGGLSGAPYATLMGRPVLPIEQCKTLGTVGDVIFADMSQYVLADKGGLQSASSMHVAFLTDEQVFRFTYRVDGQPLWQSALTPYNGTNTLSPFVVVATRT